MYTFDKHTIFCCMDASIHNSGISRIRLYIHDGFVQEHLSLDISIFLNNTGPEAPLSCKSTHKHNRLAALLYLLPSCFGLSRL